MMKISKIISPKSKKKYCEGDNSEYFGIFHLLKWKFQNSNNYSTGMCWNGQGTTVVGSLVVGLKPSYVIQIFKPWTC